MPGVTGYPPLSNAIRSNTALSSVAATIREFHDATQGFVSNQIWHGYEIAHPSTYDCIGHYDLAPWNITFEGEQVTGIIDWDAAGPSSRVWDWAYAAYQFVPFHPHKDLRSWGWNEEPNRRRRLRLFLESYGGDISEQDNSIWAGDHNKVGKNVVLHSRTTSPPSWVARRCAASFAIFLNRAIFVSGSGKILLMTRFFPLRCASIRPMNEVSSSTANAYAPYWRFCGDLYASNL